LGMFGFGNVEDVSGIFHQHILKSSASSQDNVVPFAKPPDGGVHGVVISIRRTGGNPETVVGVKHHLVQLARMEPFERNIPDMGLTMADAFLQRTVCMLGFAVISYNTDQRSVHLLHILSKVTCALRLNQNSTTRQTIHTASTNLFLSWTRSPIT